jgi:2-hydroxychromene-2-carboxylate isomerase
MEHNPKVIHYFDYKSPYAYLAQEETYKLQVDFNIEIDWLPCTLDIPSFLGAAELDESGRDTVQTRNAHQWRRVKYSYMDCRREASRRGLIIRGPRKIFDSSIAHIGFLYAKRQGSFRPFHDFVYERFWKRELDIENPQEIARLLEEVGVDSSGFIGYLSAEGRQEHDRIQRGAETRGVFGVPSYLVDDELFWGAERIVRVRELLDRN